MSFGALLTNLEKNSMLQKFPWQDKPRYNIVNSYCEGLSKKLKIVSLSLSKTDNFNQNRT